MASRYRFDDIEIDTQSFRLLKVGKVVQAEPKTLNLLIFLVENRGRLLARQEIIDAVWKEAFVTDHVLNRAMGQLRKGLGDDAKEPRYIETVPTRGYRFIAQIQGENSPGNSNGAPPAAIAVEFSAPPGSVPVAKRSGTRRLVPFAILAAVALACALIVAFLVLRGKSPFEYYRPGKTVQITTSPGTSNYYPTFSPDGTAVAYSTDSGKGFEVFVRQLTPEGREVQITADGKQNVQAAWSPDGKLLAYASYSRGGIWLISPLGGPGRQLTEFGSHPAWSPDNQWIAFSSDPARFSLGSAIWVIRPDGTGARQITTPGTARGSQVAPSWSPDGKHILFLSNDVPGADLWSITPDGKGLVRLSPAEFPSAVYDAIYSPDGRSVVFAADRGLWQIRISPQSSAPVGRPVQITTTTGEGWIKNLAFSRDGKRLLYAAATSTSALQSLSLSPSGEPIGPPVALTADNNCESSLPAFSRDGKRIAFYSCNAGSAGQIWLMNSGGSGLRQLTSSPSSFAAPPSWYPDGKHILYFSNQDGKYRFFSIDTETRQQQLVAELQQPIDRFALSPEGAQLAFGSPTGRIWNVWIRDLATGKMKQVTFDAESVGWPLWSPDGKVLSADVWRGPETNIMVLPSGGGPVTQLTSDHGNNFSAGWSPDGDKIFFAKRPAFGFWNVWSVSRSTRTEKQITHYTKLNTQVYSPVMSPQGNQLVYEYVHATGNIWMLELEQPQ
jgi:Tol biopolymer transport system component/DNA-binding winged helix-turn-helix (wHTH) protein